MGIGFSGICGSKEKTSKLEHLYQKPIEQRTLVKPITNMEREILEKWGIESPQNTALVDDSPETFGATSPKNQMKIEKKVSRRKDEILKPKFKKKRRRVNSQEIKLQSALWDSDASDSDSDDKFKVTFCQQLTFCLEKSQKLGA